MAETDRFIKSNLRSWLEIRGSKNEQRPVALVLLESDVPISTFDRSRNLLDGIIIDCHDFIAFVADNDIDKLDRGLE